MTTKENMIFLLRRIMTVNNLTEVEILEDMQHNVLWYDNGGWPSEDAITKLLWDGEELGLELSTFGGNVTVYEDDAAFNDLVALHEVLGSVFMTVCKMPEIIYSDSYDMVEELFVDILEKRTDQDSAHILLMMIVRYIAAERLKSKYNQPLKYFIMGEEDDPRISEIRTEFQKEVDEICREEYERYASIFANGTDENGMTILPYSEKVV